MFNYALRVLKTATLRQSGITFVGTFATGILGLVFSIVVARALGAESFGVYSFMANMMALLATIGDFGTNTGIVKFVGKYYTEDKTKALRFMKFALEIKISSWLAIAVLGWLSSLVIAEVFLNKPELTTALRVSFLGFGVLLLFSFVSFCLQALQKYWSWSFLGIAMNLLRLIVALAFLASVGLGAYSGIFLYILFPFLGFIVGLFLLPNFWRVDRGYLVAREFISYNKWVALFGIVAAVTARVDTFLITRFLTLSEMGIYSVALNLSSIVPQIVFAVAVVAAPKLTQFKDEKAVIGYLKKLQMFVIGLGFMGMLSGVPLAYFIIPALYGQEFIGSLMPFVILLGAQVIFLASVPVHTSIFYYFSYPKLFVWIEMVHLVVVFIASWMLIPTLGISGAAWAIFIGNIVNFIVPAMWVVLKFKKKL